MVPTKPHQGSAPFQTRVRSTFKKSKLGMTYLPLLVCGLKQSPCHKEPLQQQEHHTLPLSFYVHSYDIYNN